MLRTGGPVIQPTNAVQLPASIGKSLEDVTKNSFTSACILELARGDTVYRTGVLSSNFCPATF